MARADKSAPAVEPPEGVALVALEPILLDGVRIAPDAGFTARPGVADVLIRDGAARPA